MKKTETGHTLFAVSTGPSDSRYLTQEAIKVIDSCKTIFYPITSSGTRPNIAFDCIKEITDIKNKNCIGIRFSMTGNKDKTEEEYKSIVKQISRELQNNNAALIAIGDISIYSTAAHIADIIGEMGFNTKFVSGVPSFCAAAGMLKLDLAESNEEISIIPGDAYIKNGKLDEALERQGTKIIMKSSRHLKEILAKIEEKNLTEHSSLIHNAGFKNEKVFRGKELLSIPEDFYLHAYMSIIIIKKDKKLTL
ncbi:MAG: precorrin-2 C(20)-methyltransferase [Treponema sp.]|nr:precorrin-2 C(20)-methyltransferase [Treponema sp.]